MEFSVCKLFQIFPTAQTLKNQTYTNVFTNAKSQFDFCKLFQIFSTVQKQTHTAFLPQKISRKVLRNEFSSGETVYVGTKAVCGKDHKRASTAYGCKYIHLKCDDCCTNLTFIKIKSLLKATFAKKKKS